MKQIAAVQAMIAYELAKIIYSKVLRPIAVKSIRDSDPKIDDHILQVCDTIFQHGTKPPVHLE